MSTGVPSTPDPAQPLAPPMPPPVTLGESAQADGAPEPAWTQRPSAAPRPGVVAPGGVRRHTVPPMGPQRNTLVFVVSIILITGGGLLLLSGLMIGIMTYPLGKMDWLLRAFGLSAGIASLAVTWAIVTGICAIVAGIIGVQGAADPEKADLMLRFGILLCVLALIGLIPGSATRGVMSWFVNALYLVPLVLYLVGAFQLRRQAAART